MVKSILKRVVRPIYLYLKDLKVYSTLVRTNPSLKLKGSCVVSNVKFGKCVGLYNATISNSSIGDYSYLAKDAFVNHAEVGKYCSIGPGVKIGLGQHPTRDFISTHPVFYSSKSFTGSNKYEFQLFEEFVTTRLGHDVWIGANAIVKDGISIGNGVVIAAGAVVTKDIPDYAIAAGVPARVLKYRFTKEIIQDLLNLKWWDYSVLKTEDVENVFTNVENIDLLRLSIDKLEKSIS